MKPADIKRNRTYITRQGWHYFVTDIVDSATGDAFVEYTVTSGGRDMEGARAVAPMHDFTDRVVRTVANQVLTLKGGL